MVEGDSCPPVTEVVPSDSQARTSLLRSSGSQGNMWGMRIVRTAGIEVPPGPPPKKEKKSTRHEETMEAHLFDRFRCRSGTGVFFWGGWLSQGLFSYPSRSDELGRGSRLDVQDGTGVGEFEGESETTGCNRKLS